MNAFESAVNLERDDDAGDAGATGRARFRAEVPAGWNQGRGAFGGLVLAYLARAFEAIEPPPSRRIRTLTGDILSAVQPGPVVARVKTVRRGKHQSNLQATLEQNGEIVATAAAVASGPRPESMGSFAPEPPELVEMPVVAFAPPIGPAFAQHYEYRSKGPFPFTRGPEAVADGYIAERGERTTPYDTAAVTALLDAWWPAYLVRLEQMRAMATIAFTAQYLKDPASLAADAKFRFRAKTIAGADGFVVELRELWSGGELVALNQQTFALLR